MSVSRSQKRNGFIQESLVAIRLLELGFNIAKVEGDDAAYDLVSDWDGKLNRVQVKSTSMSVHSSRGSLYRFICGKGSRSKKLYTKKDCDFIVGVAIPKNLFYIIPIERVQVILVQVYPEGRSRTPKDSADFEEYREAWNLLK